MKDFFTDDVIRIDKEGFHYRGQFIADAGEAHRLMVEFLKQSARPEPPAAGEVAELVDALKNDAECVEAEHYDLCYMTAGQMCRAADLLERLAQPEPQDVDPWPMPGDAEGLAEVFWGPKAQPESQGPHETAWALAQLLDGVQRHDLPNMTGLSDSDCDRIWAARPATTEDQQ